MGLSGMNLLESRGESNLCKSCDAIVHLAAVNRTMIPVLFMIQIFHW